MILSFFTEVLNLQHIAGELEQLLSQLKVIGNAFGSRLLAVAHVIPTQEV